ncbi:hypothetical protein GCM10023340_27680 [Nocardioides marinquilinus]|uniref:Transcriptional regulator, AbiEi antitoxin, Type IV TA system n=1 Tax=Nocardioides marinquilinus TaxID=1210400 RepID=A0ABP9PQI7_9ACTN
MTATPPRRAADDPRHAPIALRRELLAVGHNDRSIARMLGSGDLARVRWGAYVDGPTWASLDDVGRHGLRTRAAVRQANADVVVSHLSAAVEHDVPTWGLDLSEVHLTRTDGRAGRRERGIAQHCGLIEDGDVVELNGLSVMSPTRTALEVTTAAGLESSLVVVNHLLHHELTTADALAARATSMRDWPGTLRTQLVLTLADARIASPGESRCWHLFFRGSLPMPEPQYAVRDETGAVVAIVDFAWPELGVFLEFDGKVKYEKLLRKGERSSDVVVREKRREELIVRLTGWRCIRLIWAELERPTQTAAMINQVLREQSARRVAAGWKPA